MREATKKVVPVIIVKVIAGLSTIGLYVTFSHYLSPEKLGLYELALTIIMLLSHVLCLGFIPFISGEFTRKGIEGVEESTNKINSAYAIYATSALVITSIILIFFWDKTKFSAMEWCAILGAAYLFFYRNLYPDVLRSTFRPIKCSIFEGLYPLIVFMILTVYLMSSEGQSLTILLASNLIALLIIAIFYFLENTPNIRFFGRITLTEFKNVIKTSLPWFFVAIVSWIMYSSDRWVLEYFIGTYEVGLFAQIFKMSSAYTILVLSTIYIIFTPHIYKSFRINKKIITWRMINRQSYYLVLFTMFLLFIDWLIGESIYRLIVGEMYYEAFKYNYFIIINLMLAAIIGFYNYVFIHKNITLIIQISLVVGTATNLLLSILLTPYLGIYGVIMSSSVSQSGMLAYTIYQSKKYFFTNSPRVK